jgi:FAD/FMN-containing dehydrogenase
LEYTAPKMEAYLQDASGYRGEADRIFAPANLLALEQLLHDSHTSGTPITVAGAGTGLTGARVPHGGHVVSLENFRDIEIGKGWARCGAGVILMDLQRAAAQTRQFFGPNPTEDSASIGGIFSTNAGGARSYHYGSVRKNVLAAEVTFSDGHTVRFERGQKVDFDYQCVSAPFVTKNSAGYFLQPELDWLDLLAGSEGTLAVASTLELMLLPQPPAILSGVVFFPEENLAFNAVDEWRSVAELRLLEFMDERSLNLLRPQYADIPPEAQAALLIEQNLITDDSDEVDLWNSRLQENQALEEGSWFGFSTSDQDRFRKFRHHLALIVTERARRNGFAKFSTDFAVPLSRHRELHRAYRQRCEEKLSGRYVIFGHVGDANNHINMLPETREQAQAGEDLMYEFAQLVVSMGGTVAAEHGIGKTKTELLSLMYSAKDLDSMRAVKKHLDPRWLLGQGNLFPMPVAQ